MKKVALITLPLFALALSAFVQIIPHDNYSVASLLFELGEKKPLHYVEWDEKQSKIGETLFFKGKTADSKRISKHYVCSSCHNTKQEDPDLANPNPKDRLNYAKENNLPFLQGSTMFGVVNRTTWYNEDYEKKYGSLVIPARDTLRNAIQLCAKVCSQGRELEDWELEAFVHYFWSLQIHIDDLDMTSEQRNSITEKNEGTLDLLKSKFKPYSPATFVNSIPPGERKLGENGNAENGKIIFNQSCLHCHHPKERITNLKLEDNKLSHQLLNMMLKSTSDKSVYEIVRKGTYPIAGYKPYMPHYTEERLTNDQIEDLVAYIKSQCN